jgi:hypothetical protein
MWNCLAGCIVLGSAVLVRLYVAGAQAQDYGSTTVCVRSPSPAADPLANELGPRRQAQPQGVLGLISITRPQRVHTTTLERVNTMTLVGRWVTVMVQVGRLGCEGELSKQA